MKINYNTLKNSELAYIAGFIDGDGSIIAQIVRGDSYRYGFRIKVYIGFYQKTERHWFLLKCKSQLKYGYVRKRNDGISEYIISGVEPVKALLHSLLPFLLIKRKAAINILNIIEEKKKIKTPEDFLNVCVLVDKSSKENYSKKRSVTAEVVLEDFKKKNL